jgi:hypothetical protein
MSWWKRARIETRTSFWMTDPACAEGFLGDVQELLKAQHFVLVVTHFSETHRRVGQQLADRGVRSVLLSGVHDLAPRRIETLCKDGAVALVPFPLIQLGALPPGRNQAVGQSGGACA